MSSANNSLFLYYGIVILMTISSAKQSLSLVYNNAKDNIYTNMFFSNILNNLNENMKSINYMEAPKTMNSNSIQTRVYHNNRNGGIYQGAYPSIRADSFLQHSSVWGHKYIPEELEEGLNQMKITNLDANLPAYCNPPNPCPYGYNIIQNCIIAFDNTAIFSREFQASQECMCDSEHMFDCTPIEKSVNKNLMTTDIEKLMMQGLTVSDQMNLNILIENENPFLSGEQIPIAAKKGNHVN